MYFRSTMALAVAAAISLTACGPQPTYVQQAPVQPQVVYQQPVQQQPQVVYQPPVVYAQPVYNNGYMDFAAGALLSAAVISAMSPSQYVYRNGQYYSTTVIHQHVDRSTYDRISAKNAQINAQQSQIAAQRQQLAAQRQQMAAQQQQHAAQLAAARAPQATPAAAPARPAPTPAAAPAAQSRTWQKTAAPRQTGTWTRKR